MNVAVLGFAAFGFFCSALVAFGLAGAVFAALGFSAFGFPAVCFSALGSCALAVTVMPVIADARHMPPIRLRVTRNRKGRLADMIYVILLFRRFALRAGRRVRGRQACWCRRVPFAGCLRRTDEAAKVEQAAARGSV